MNKKRREAIATNQVSRMMSFSLGGHEQKVLLDGKSEKNPVMLFLHGGPGAPLPFSAGSRGLHPEFTEHFIMAYWDQLGCGINDAPIDETFSVDSFADMTADLIRALKKEFPDNPLILFGVSWGSVLTAKAAAQLPDLVDAVLVYGQFLTDTFFNEEVFETFRDVGVPQKILDKATAMRNKPVRTPDDLKYVATLVRKHTEGYQCKAGGNLPLVSIVWGMLSSPDYSVKNCIAMIKNGFQKNNSVWNELMQIDLRIVLREVRVPYHILQGSTDIVTSTKMISAFVAENENDFLSLRVLPNNGHMPSPDGMKKIWAESITLARVP